MEHFPKFEAEEIGKVKPGTFCGFMKNGKLHLGFAFVNPLHRTPGYSALDFLSLSPGVEAFDNRPGFGGGADNFFAKSLIIFPDARIRLPFEAGSTRTGMSDEEIAGAVVLIDGVLAISALVERSARLISLEDGTPMTRRAPFHPYFPSWSVETKDTDGTWKTLCAFNFGV